MAVEDQPPSGSVAFEDGDQVCDRRALGMGFEPKAVEELYDLVSDTPGPVLKQMARESGRMRMLLLWLHAFEEPFYSRYGLEELPRPTPFEEGQTRFVSVMCRLAVEKKA